MKTTRWGFVVAFATLLAAGVAQAQVQFVFVEKMVVFTQTSELAPSVAAGTPYQFKFEINGTGLSGYGTPQAVEITTTATGSGVSGPVGTSYTINGSEESWKTAPLNYTSLGLMDADFANGVYGLNVNNTAFNLTLGGGLGPYTSGFPAAAPMLTGLSAGDFDGSGNLKINLGLSSYTFTLNGLPGYSSGGHVGIFINSVSDPAFISGGNPGGYVQGEAIKFGVMNDPELTFLTFNPSASNMVLGNTYTLELEYNLAPNAASNLLGAGELDLGLFTYRTTVSLIAVPEPATYAEIFGVVALAGLMFRRRRQTA